MYGIFVRTVSYLRRYCRHVPNFLRFRTADEGLFLCLVLNVPNIWHLAHLAMDLFKAEIKFSPYFHFGHYFFILPLLVPKIKNRSILISIVSLLTKNSIRDKQNALLAQ